MNPIRRAEEIFDGYQLLKFINQGGFGEVWICKNLALGTLHAFKWIDASRSNYAEQELRALQAYKQIIQRKKIPHILPIEHVNQNEFGLFYIMPLADGHPEQDPLSPHWRPLTLRELIYEAEQAKIKAQQDAEEAKKKSEHTAIEKKNSRRLIDQRKAQLAELQVKMADHGKRYQESVATINKLTRNRTVGVREGSYEFQLCQNASNIINQIDAAAPEMKQEKARLETEIESLEESLKSDP